MVYGDDHYQRGGNAGAAFALGLMTGALLGVGLGLLFAPKDGAAMRRELARRARELQEDAAGWYEQAAGAARDLAEESRDAAHDLAGKGREAAHDLAEKGREATQRARTAVTGPT